MSLDNSQNRAFFPLDGKVLTSGGSLNVTEGVLAIVDNDPQALTQNGKKVVSSFVGLPKHKDFQILLGKKDLPVTRTTDNKPYASLPFKLSEVVDLKVFAPKSVGVKVDDFIVGFNGTDGTELSLKSNSSSVIELTLCGEPMLQLGYKTGEVTVSVTLQAPYVDSDGVALAGEFATMQERVEYAVKEFQRMTLLGGAPITDYVDIIAVNSENGDLSGTAYTFRSLTVTDAGDSNAFARVQAQYPTLNVVKTERIGDEKSVYTVLVPSATVLADFEITSAGSLKTCEDCPSGFTATDSGFVYHITVEDDGVNLSTDVDGIAGYVSGSISRKGNVDGVGTYTVVTDDAVTEAEIATFKASTVPLSTAVVTFVGEVSAVCTPDAVVDEIAWVLGNTCYATTKTFEIKVADDDCGNARLAELQASYPNLTIAVKTEDSTNSRRTITLTGSSGTANINIAGTNYLATFATNLTTTANNFVSTHGANITTATGGTVTASAGVITYTDATVGFPTITITNDTTNLAGTLGTVSVVAQNVNALCQTTYTTTIATNIVCEECSNEFRDLFTAEAPGNFGQTAWTLVTDSAFDADAKMGIRFRGKEFKMIGSEYFRDDMPMYWTSTKLKVAGGQPTFVAESWNNQDKPYKITVLSIASDPEAFGAQLWQTEDESRHYFDGLPRFEGNNYAKWLWGQETKLKGDAQYVDYQLTVNPIKGYQYTPHASEQITYRILVEVGRHTGVEALLNAVAVGAGIPTVQAFGN